MDCLLPLIVDFYRMLFPYEMLYNTLKNVLNEILCCTVKNKVL